MTLQNQKFSEGLETKSSIGRRPLPNLPHLQRNNPPRIIPLSFHPPKHFCIFASQTSKQIIEQQGIGGHQKYATAFNDTMNKIWKEQIALLGVIGTDRLFRFRASARLTAKGEFSGIQLSQILKEKSHGSLTL